VHLEPPETAPARIQEPEPEAAAHPGEEVAVLQGHHLEALEGPAAEDARDQEEAQHEGEHQVEQVVPGVDGEGPHAQQGHQVLGAQPREGQTQAAVVPEPHRVRIQASGFRLQAGQLIA
jgi:hypothetical protein